MKFSLKAINLKKSYKKRIILEEISLHVSTGEVIALLGPNGAGKTTCFSIMCGLVSPDQGKIFIDELEITSLPLYKRAKLGIGYLPQESSIFKGMTVEDNIRSILELTALSKQEITYETDRLLDEFSLTHLRGQSAVVLSGGERRRVEIARVLAMNPKFILLDEPFAGIDPIAIGEIRDLILYLKEKKIGILITDHHVRETLEIINRAYILHNGSVLTEGNAFEILSSQDVKRLYLGDKFVL